MHTHPKALGRGTGLFTQTNAAQRSHARDEQTAELSDAFAADFPDGVAELEHQLLHQRRATEVTCDLQRVFEDDLDLERIGSGHR